MAADLFCPPWPVEKCQLGIVGVGPGGTKYTRGNRRPFLSSRFRFFCLFELSRTLWTGRGGGKLALGHSWRQKSSMIMKACKFSPSAVSCCFSFCPRVENKQAASHRQLFLPLAVFDCGDPRLDK